MKALAATAACAGLAVLAILVGLGIGSRMIGPTGVATALLSPDEGIEGFLVWTLRLPRSLAALLAGAGLAVSGCLLQALTRNPLAGPGLTGVTAGAVAAIVGCFVFLPWVSDGWYPAIGLAGGLLAALVTFWIAGGGAGRPVQLALGGIGVSLFLGAVTTHVLLSSGPQAPSLLFWLAGGFQGRSWAHLAHLAPWVILGCAGALACRRVLGLLALSEQAAAGMGLNLAFWKPVLLLLAVLPVAGIAPVAGPIAFVGLAAPHLARMIAPAGPGSTLALSAAIGGLMVTLADILARSVAAPREIPVGLVTALLGGPVFIHLAQRRAPAGRGG